MLTAVFRGHEGFIAVGLVIVALTGWITYRAARTRTSRPVTYALWVSSAVGVTVLTTWTTGGVSDSAVCVVNKDLLEPFSGTQGVLNAGMFVPFAFLGTVATRRPALVALLGVVLSASVETLQGSASVVGRLCDTSDLVANAAGVIAGVALGVVLEFFDADKGGRLAVRTARVLALASCVAAAAVTATWFLRISPQVVERTVNDVEASEEQKESVASAVRAAFDGHYSVDSVRFMHGEGDAGTVMAWLATEKRSGAGWAELTWPDTDRLSIDLIPTAIEKGHAFEVPHAPRSVETEKQARVVATAYAEQYAPWALEGTRLSVTRSDTDENTAWQATWRKQRGDVLMPVRLGVRLEKSGRLIGLMTHDVPDPRLPPVRWDVDRAWGVFARHFADGPEGGEREEPVLQASWREGRWRVEWLLTVRTREDRYSAVVDASTGELHEAEHVPRTAR